MIIWKIKAPAGYEDIECAWTSRDKAIEYTYKIIRAEEWDIVDDSSDGFDYSLLVSNPVTNNLFTLKIEPLFLDEEPFI